MDGDTTQLQKQTQKLLIPGIDTINNMIRVDQSISWNPEAGVKSGIIDEDRILLNRFTNEVYIIKVTDNKPNKTVVI
jgi:hypothetical protein